MTLPLRTWAFPEAEQGAVIISYAFQGAQKLM